MWLYVRPLSMPRLLGFWISPNTILSSAIYPKKSTLGTIYQRNRAETWPLSPKVYSLYLRTTQQNYRKRLNLETHQEQILAIYLEGNFLWNNAAPSLTIRSSP